MAQPWPRLTIPTRIFLSIVLVLLAFGGVSGASLYQHQRSAERVRLLHEGYLPLALTIGQQKTTHTVFLTLLERVLDVEDARPSRAWLDAARRVRPATLRRGLTGIQRAERLYPSAEDTAALVEIRENLDAVGVAYAENEALYAALSEAVAAGDEARSDELLHDLVVRERAVSRRFRAAWGQVQSRIAQTSRTAADQERQFLYVVALLALLALAIGLVVLFWSQRLLAPLPRLQRRVAAVARGDLDGRVEAARDDEIGQLTTEFERMVDAVGARDRQLRDAAETLRELQQMQEQIVAGLRAGVVVVDEEGVVRSANRAAETVLELSDEAVGQLFADLGLQERVPGLADALDEVATGGDRAVVAAAPFASSEPPEAQGARPSGLEPMGAPPRFVDVLVTPFGFEPSAGPRRSVLVVADDVTEALQTKQRLIQTERLAVIGRMAAHVTHEVRNPLSSIGLNVELLEEEVADSGAEAKALLRAITREIDRLSGLTEEYLRLARLPAPRLEPEQLGDIVEEVGRFVAREFEVSPVTLAVRVEADLPLVAADEAQIRQSLLNLLRNARESMPEGGEARLEARTHDGGVEIRVSDQGEGIPAAQRPHIFDLFYSTKERGTGLGLPLTMQIVAAHGGSIRCDDAEGGGTVFTLWFPLHQEGTASGQRALVEEAAVS